MLKKIHIGIAWLALVGMIGSQTPLPAAAPETAATEAPAKVLSAEELDTLLAPIALYPDPLLAQILPAATSPSDVVLAARYVAAKKDANQIDKQPWEESVKALARYPDVLKMMDEKLDWTTALGEAFVAQPKDVFNSVQRLRAKAQAAGNLKDSPQQVIVVEKEVIKIVPAQPDVVYVPVYSPSVVYVAQPPSVAATVITFGAALALGIWIHNELDWHHHHVYYHSHGWHGGGYHGGNNNINIDNSTNINIGNGNGNGSGNVWKPQNKPKPTPYGGGNNNWANNANGPSNRPNTPNGNNPSGPNGQQKPASRPSQPTTRPANPSKPGFLNEGTKSRPNTGNRSAQTSRPSTANRDGGGGRRNSNR
jgi:hypothetical protein